MKFKSLSETLTNFFVLVSLLTVGFAQSQVSPAQKTAGKPLGSTNTVQNNSSYKVKQGDCVKRKFSIAFYVLLDSNEIPYATQAQISQLLDTLNHRFAPICVEFMNCKYDSIPIYPYAKWDSVKVEDAVTAGYYTPNTINLYVVDSMKPLLADDEGYTYYPPAGNPNTARKDIIVIRANYLTNFRCAYTLHLFGHYFGLPHTHGEINPVPAVPGPPPGVTSNEFVDGSNCKTHGDGFCDTDADAGSMPLFTKDGHGHYYLSPWENLMSLHTARCRFSNEQYLFMANIIRTKRMYLH